MELQRLMQTEEEDIRQKELNTIAEFVITRVQDKLRGMEFSHKNVMKIDQNAEQQVKISQKRDVDDQVDILIKQATNHENLAACYMGWCPYW
jgi:FKBP12-rapamycin complex-associated protein